MNKIDFVILWVDGADEKWLAEKAKYSNNVCKEAGGVHRFRDWDNLQYWFRGVEKFAPWVNQIHFVTWGHLPKWLNKNHPKLNIVQHSDFIPEKYLPTFSANPIELNIHKIHGLQEKFVFFNDDMFIIDKVSEKDFFVKGLPCNTFRMDLVETNTEDDLFFNILVNDLVMMKRNFKRYKLNGKNFFKHFNIKYGLGNINNLFLLRWKGIHGFTVGHLPNAFLKSTFETIWEREYEKLDEVCQNKFRSKMDVNQYVCEWWQLLSGNFYPRSSKLGRVTSIGNDINRICNSIINQDYKIICINDGDDVTDFEKQKEQIKNAFEHIFPEKSEYEL